MAERGFRQTFVIVAAASTVVAALTPTQAEAVASAVRSELWVSRFNGPANTQDGGSAIRVSPDGSKVYVTGHGHFDVADDYTTSAHDAVSGAVLWASRYDGPGGSVDVAYAMALSSDGSRLFVTGASAGTAGEDVATVAYDTVDGSRLWVSRGVPHIPDYGGAIAVSPDGSRVFVTGAKGIASASDYLTLAYDASDGHLVWNRSYDGPGHTHDQASSIAASPDGSKVFVTGWSYGGGVTGNDYATIAYDAATGAGLFLRRYDNAGGSDNAYTLAVSPDGATVAVAGTSWSDLGTVFDYATVAYDAATGVQRWVGRYSTAGAFLDTAYAVAFAPDGAAVYVTGSAGDLGPSGLDYATAGFDASTGGQLWARRYSSPGNARDRALSIGVAPDGTTVFVTGESFVGGSSSYLTQAYRAADGAPRWSRPYDGPAHGVDVAAGIAVSPDGSRVFVTGASERSSGNSDIATVAYGA